MSPIHVFPDADVLLHFQRIDQIAWTAVVGARNVVVVLAPSVLREIEKAKDQPPHRRARQRARNLSSWLRERRRSGDRSLPNGASFEVGTREPTEFLGGELAADIGDDRLIASVLAYKSEDQDVAVVTNDTLLLHKLDVHGIPAFELSEDLRLKDEPDEVERERADLERRVIALTSRVPVLELAWAVSGGQDAKATVPPLSFGEVADPDEVRRQYPPMVQRSGRTATDRMVAAAAAYGSQFGISDEAVENYNKNLEVYLRKYEQYYGKVRNIVDWRRRRYDLVIDVRNAGTAVASNVVVTLTLPDGILPLEDTKGPGLPDRPEPPQKPTVFGLEPSLALSPHLFRTPAMPNFRDMIPDPSLPEVDVERKLVTWEQANILHGRSERLRPATVLLRDILPGTRLTIRAEVHAAELLKPATTELYLEMN